MPELSNYNLFAPKKPTLTPPVSVFDTSGSGTPSARDIVNAYRTPSSRQQVQTTPGAPVAPSVVQPRAGGSDLTDQMDAFAKSLLYTSPAREEQLRKSSVANRRLVAVADALRHVGNIVHTVKGAPSQQFNNPVLDERTRYEQGRSVRNAANLQYMSYQQAKAAQDAKMRQLDTQQRYNNAKLALEEEKMRLQRELSAARKATDLARIQEIQARINRINALLPGEQRLQDARIVQSRASAANSSASAALANARREHPERFGSRSSLSGYRTERRRVVTKYDAFGKPVEWKDITVRVPDQTEGSGGGVGDEFDLELESVDDETDLRLQ